MSEANHVMSGELLSVNVVRKVRADGPDERTAIDKRSVDARVYVNDLGLAGDFVCDTVNHGGLDQAVYAYAREDAQWWERELDRELAPGAFGENLSTEGLDVTNAIIGEQWAVGEALLEVSCPRIPCATFQRFWDVPRLVKRFTEHGACGAYLRVLGEGEIGAGDAIRVVHRPAHGVTLGESFRGLSGDRDVLPRLLQAPELAAPFADKARRLLAAAR